MLARRRVHRGHLHLLIGDKACGPSADAGVTADDGLPVLDAILLEAAAIHDARNDFAHVVLLGRIGGKNAIHLFRRIGERLRLDAMEARLRRGTHHTDQSAHSPDARLVIGLAEVHGTAHLGVGLWRRRVPRRKRAGQWRPAPRRSRRETTPSLPSSEYDRT